MSEARHCGPCENEGEHEETVVKFCIECDEHLCADCWKYHTKIKTLRTHNCVDLDRDTDDLNVEENEGNDEGETVERETDEGETGVVPIHCPQHQEELMEHYCIDCDEGGCGQCMSVRHTDCPYIDFPDVSRFIPTDRELDDDDYEFTELLEALTITKESLRKVDTGMDTLSKTATESETDIPKQLDALDADISQFMTMSLEMLGHVSDDIREVEKDHLDRVGIVMKEIERFRQVLEVRKDGALDFCVFHVMTSVNQLLKDLTDISNKQKSGNSLDLMDQVLKFVHGVNRFSTEMTHKPFGNSNVISMDINADSNDPKDCAISGAIVTGNRAIVADTNNKKVKVFDTENEKLIAESYLPILFREA